MIPGQQRLPRQGRQPVPRADARALWALLPGRDLSSQSHHIGWLSRDARICPIVRQNSHTRDHALAREQRRHAAQPQDRVQYQRDSAVCEPKGCVFDGFGIGYRWLQVRCGYLWLMISHGFRPTHLERMVRIWIPTRTENWSGVIISFSPIFFFVCLFICTNQGFNTVEEMQLLTPSIVCQSGFVYPDPSRWQRSSPAERSHYSQEVRLC